MHLWLENILSAQFVENAMEKNDLKLYNNFKLLSKGNIMIIQMNIKDVLQLIIRSIEIGKYNNALEIAKSTLKQYEENEKSDNEQIKSASIAEQSTPII